jgi:prepilin-type processing-associated H-X9-DG protein
MTCKNNLKQIGLGLQTYHDALAKFPPSARWKDFRTTPTIVDQSNVPNINETWVILMLPYVEQQGIYEQFNRDAYISDVVNRPARMTKLDFMMCPEDTYNEVILNAASSGSGSTTALGDGWARGNYAANASLGYMAYTGAAAAVAWVPGANKAWNDKRYRGVMGANDSLTLGDISAGDGTSSTILAAEIRSGVSDFDIRGTWALVGAGPSALWAHGTTGAVNGPNSPGADQIWGGNDVAIGLGGASVLQGQGMPVATGNNRMAGPRSLHEGGVHALFCDGSVHFIGDFVDIQGSGSPPYSVWDRLNLSNDGKSVEANQYEK